LPAALLRLAADGSAALVIRCICEYRRDNWKENSVN
jgi:hypothetical protein